VQTWIQMLAAGLVTTDVQPLYSKATGDVLFIDMTEAKMMANPPSFLDKALAASFCTEMLALIPESLLDLASNYALEEVKSTEHRLQGDLPMFVYELLSGQTSLSENFLVYVDSKLISTSV